MNTVKKISAKTIFALLRYDILKFRFFAIFDEKWQRQDIQKIELKKISLELEKSYDATNQAYYSTNEY